LISEISIHLVAQLSDPAAPLSQAHQSHCISLRMTLFLHKKVNARSDVPDGAQHANESAGGQSPKQA
jgi:hypothetical protein